MERIQLVAQASKTSVELDPTDKSFICEVASSGLPVEEVLPNGYVVEFSTMLVLPDGIEDQFPEVPSAKKKLIQMREDLKKWIVDNHPFTDTNPVLSQLNTYLLRIHQLVGKENYEKKKKKLASVKELRKTMQLNHNLKKKLQEYQRRLCASCNKTAPPRQCSRCKKVFYCSQECQKANWLTHKTDCR